MRIFGLEITRTKAQAGAVSTVDSGRGWFSLIREPWGGAWQSSVSINSPKDILAFSAVFSCTTGIAADLGKLRPRVVQEREDGTYLEVPSTSPLAAPLFRPNHFQNIVQFVTLWAVTKLLWGNVYGLKERDARGMVRAIYILDPQRVTPLITEQGDVYYQIDSDNLSRVADRITVPASEIIHDRMVTLWHPLVGVSPIYACGMTATMGNKIQANSAGFFGNASMPSGMLTAPGTISSETAARLKTEWEQNYSGKNIGRVAIAGDALEYKPFTMPAVDSQLIEQLQWTVADVARAYHYPMHKLGGDVPSGATVEALNLQYYADCLQTLIEQAEACFTDGLGLPRGYEVEFDLEGLIRMDGAAKAESEERLVKGGIKSPNEARACFNLPPVPGGASPYLQQQNFSLEALAKRDAQEDPFKTSNPAPAAKPEPPSGPAANDDSAEEAAAEQARELIAAFTKGLEHA
jgi:HK97 family phage portal protein